MFSFLQQLLQKEFWIWLTKNKSTFILTILLLTNVYQYYDFSKYRSTAETDLKDVNTKLTEANKNSLQYERDRSNTLEMLLHDLVLKYNSQDSTSKPKKM